MSTAQWIRMAPLLLMLIITSLIATGIFNDASPVGKRMGKAIGNFSVERLDDPSIKFNQASLRDQIVIINLFASWCAPCRAEHDVIMDLARTGVAPIYGIAFRDKREDAIRFLQAHGNPYQVVGLDRFGSTTIPFSMSGVPETLVIGRDGKVYYHHVSALTKLDVQEIILPLIERLKAM